MRDKKVLYITQAAVIAALYVVLTVLFAPISFKEVQVRISEMLTSSPTCLAARSRLTSCAEVWQPWQAHAGPG